MFALNKKTVVVNRLFLRTLTNVLEPNFYITPRGNLNVLRSSWLSQYKEPDDQKLKSGQVSLDLELNDFKPMLTCDHPLRMENISRTLSHLLRQSGSLLPFSPY